MGTPRRSKRITLIVVVSTVVVLGAAALKYSSADGGGSEENFSAFTVQRGDLVMSVAESGTIMARNSVEIKSEVEGQTTIVSIVPEGTYISQEDVDAGKIVLQLDASGLTDRVNQQEIDFNSAEADYTEARESLDIQINQNDSDIQQGIMTVKFGLMDLQRYLGEETAAQAVLKYDPNEQSQFDVTALINDPNQLGGASLQEFRDLGSEITLAEQELKRALIDLDWTRKLYEKQYESRSELETAQLSADRLRIRWEQAKTALNLFILYEFPKEAERLFSEYLESERQLERIHAQARSRLAQAQARLKSMEARYLLQKERLEKLRQQLSACTVRATAPGLVIYASSNRRWGGSRTYIEVGAEVRERELIMTITNADEKDIDVKVHETNVDKVRVGQPVRIVVDAQPDKVFFGAVKKISPLPDPQSFFGNPDLKVYSTEVSIENVGPQIRPGMSARVEILIAELQDVLSIPVQSVANRDGRKVCYLITANGSSQATEIETGAFNDRFVEVVSGLSEGQRVMLNPPRLLSENRSRGERPSVAQKEPTEGDGADASASGEPELPAQVSGDVEGGSPRPVLNEGAPRGRLQGGSPAAGQRGGGQ